MALLVYALCALTALACAVLLFVAWLRSRSRMLWWSGVCFVFLTLANIVLVIHFLSCPTRCCGRCAMA